MGMNTSRSISDTAAAPAPAKTAATSAAGASTDHRNGIRRAKVHTAAPVPKIAVSLLVPSAACGAN